MKYNAITKAITRVTRRTGLDRRWIQSTDHQPERRHGGDRRTIRQRSLSQPLGSNDPQAGDGSLAGIAPIPRPPEANCSALAVSAPWTSQGTGAMLEEKPADDE